jgi:hypothetical protein
VAIGLTALLSEHGIFGGLQSKRSLQTSEFVAVARDNTSLPIRWPAGAIAAMVPITCEFCDVSIQ